MKKIILFFVLIISISCNAQNIENIDYFLEGKSIIVTYDFVNCLSKNNYDITVTFKEENGKIIIPKSIYGDVNKVSCGSKRIIWNTLSDVNELQGKWSVELDFKVSHNEEFSQFKIKIGNQIWMNKNLDVEYFRNGEPIPQAKTIEEWESASKNKQPIWCFYEYKKSNEKKYGKLYNWYAVNDIRGLAPYGWHIPSDEEWTNLINSLGGTKIAGVKMKSTSDWFTTASKGSNESGYNGLPAGYCGYMGSFCCIGFGGYWWSSTEKNKNDAYCRNIQYDNDYIEKNNNNKNCGLSVRCIKD